MSLQVAPLVSVLVSCYNHEKYIAACIDSILTQTYPRVQLIVLDDGSRDGSAEKVAALQAAYAAAGRDFIFVRKENSGLSDTLNQALARASGKYVCQFGSDDIMLPDKTAKQVAFMEANPDVAVCGGNALIIDSNGMIVNRRQKFPPQREVDFETLFAATGPGIVASTGMIRKDVLDKEGGWNPGIPLEDMYLWLKLTSRGYRMVGLNDVLMYYRKHGNNTYKNVRYMYESMMKTIADYRLHSLYPSVRQKLLRGYFLTAAKQGDKALAREILAQIPLSAFDRKVWRGLLRLILPG